MTPGPALSVLLLSAQLAGVDPARIEVPQAAPPAPAVKEEPRPVLRLTLEEIVRDQRRATYRREVGQGTIDFALAVGPETLWCKFHQMRVARGWSFKDLERGVTSNFPLGAYKFSYGNGYLSAMPAYPPQEPRAYLSASEMLRYLNMAAIQVLITPVQYAVLYEDGRQAPASVTLLREDSAGRLWATYKTTEELERIHWFVSINGTLYGMRLEGDVLVFYSKPTPVKGFHSDERLLD